MLSQVRTNPTLSRLVGPYLIRPEHSNYVCQSGGGYQACGSDINSNLIVPVTYMDPSLHTEIVTFGPGSGVAAYGVIVALATSTVCDVSIESFPTRQS